MRVRSTLLFCNLFLIAEGSVWILDTVQVASQRGRSSLLIKFDIAGRCVLLLGALARLRISITSIRNYCNGNLRKPSVFLQRVNIAYHTPLHNSIPFIDKSTQNKVHFSTTHVYVLFGRFLSMKE